MFCQVVSYYGLSYREGLELPIKVFWLYSENIQRIEADRAKRALRVAIHAQSGEAAQALMDQLHAETGEPVKLTGNRAPNVQRDSDDVIRNTLMGLDEGA
jgi:hypothetical protein